MPTSKRLLVLTASIGAGHTKAAEAIQTAIHDRYPQVKVDLVDTFSFAGPKIGKLFFGTYLAMIKRFPALYGYVYRKSEGDTLIGQLSQQELVRMMSWGMAKPLRELITTNQYQEIICTHPFPLGIVSRLKAKLGWDVPLHAVITDFTVHHSWVYPNIATYFVAHPRVREELIDQKIPPYGIAVTGIPIDSRFSLSPNRAELYRHLGLSGTKTTVLIMGGGLGWGPLEDIVTQLGQSQLDCQLVVVAGTNRELFARLQRQLDSFAMPVKLFGYIDFIPELFAITDLLVTKPGGLTASEALAKQVPMIIPNTIAGHEESNAQFLVDQKAAIMVSSFSELVKVVGQHINSSALDQWKHFLRNLGQPCAAVKIAEALCGVTSNNKSINTADLEKVME